MNKYLFLFFGILLPNLVMATSVCERSAGVVKRLEDYTNKTCDLITDDDLAAIDSFAMNAKDSPQLTQYDFKGLFGVKDFIIYDDQSVNYISLDISGLFSDLTSVKNFKLFSGIKNPASDLFRPLKNVTEIHLSVYSGELASRSFANLNKLKNLYIGNSRYSNCGLSKISKDAFTGLDNLRSLNLSMHGCLKDLPMGLFDDLGNLQKLVITHTSIKDVPPDLFRNLTDLEILDLSSNNFYELDSELFFWNDNIKQLILANNRLTYFDKKQFERLFNLQILLLGNNSIERLDKDLFHKNPNLKYLNVVNNRLDALPNDLFVNMRSLAFLAFDNNKLKDVPAQVFAPLTNRPVQIWLSGNAISEKVKIELKTMFQFITIEN